MRTGEAADFELHVVTRDEVQSGERTYVYRFEPNDAGLRDLYGAVDLFVLPTRAECFGVAAVEALASGLPVIVGNVGGAKEIVDDGRTGWLIEPTASELRQVLQHVQENRAVLPQMGLAARRSAESQFDGARNDKRLIDTVLEVERTHRQRLSNG